MPEKYPINIWVNEERSEELNKVGLADMTEEVLAGMKVLRLYCTAEQKDYLLKLYPTAKYDSATTGTIELLPADVKDKLFELAIEKKNLNIIGELLKTVE